MAADNPKTARRSQIEVGNEPALSSDAREKNRNESPHRISFRWLVTTTLTGIAGGMLLAGALYTALDRQTNFALSATRGFMTEGDRGVLGKSDRIFSLGGELSTRHVIHETATRRVGDKEFIGIKPYLRISAGLLVSTGDYAERIPRFDPIELYAEAGKANTPRNPGQGTVAANDGTIDLVNYDLASAIAVEAPMGFDGDLDIFARAAAELEGASSDVLAVDGDLGDGAFPYRDGVMSAGEGLAGEGGEPEEPADLQTTVLEKPAAPVGFKDTVRETAITQRGDTMLSLLVREGATREEAADIIRALGLDTRVIAEGVPVEIVKAADPDNSGRQRPVHVSVNRSDGKQTTVALAYSGRYVPMTSSVMETGLRGTDGSASGPRANLYQSIYATGLKNGIPEDLVKAMVRIFFFDVDFQRPAAPGDSLEVFFADPDAEEFAEEGPEVLFASLTIHGEIHKFYRFRAPDDGVVDYYDNEGRSAKKFLMRKPVRTGVFRSGFGMRKHPILGYKRPHNGVDWAAPRGTPIMAAGDGTVVEAGWKSGYGRWTKIRHANGYESHYAHQNGFAPGIAAGVHVSQGQVIGYIGTTGLSTGPHLHYELMVNGHYVDPMRIRLPRGRTLDGPILAAYERERARIDTLMHKPPVSTRLASFN
ncbi:MAG: M23 family metallopeptidase [Rhodobiaceae bacterium]|nr:M23 family metallopeptidase [Rhodobiaceae bacterium]MCC0062168.1 M23 family metallopeptidase [Rhodobiaceae bacterium]